MTHKKYFLLQLYQLRTLVTQGFSSSNKEIKVMVHSFNHQLFFEIYLWFLPVLKDDQDLGHSPLSCNEPIRVIGQNVLECTRKSGSSLVPKSHFCVLMFFLRTSSLYFISPCDLYPFLGSLEVIWCHTKNKIHMSESNKELKMIKINY